VGLHQVELYQVQFAGTDKVPACPEIVYESVNDSLGHFIRKGRFETLDISFSGPYATTLTI
jgi:hypothetical protein